MREIKITPKPKYTLKIKKLKNENDNATKK